MLMHILHSCEAIPYLQEVEVQQSLKSNACGAIVNEADLAGSKHAQSDSARVHAHAYRKHRCKGYRNERMAKGTGLGLSVTKQIVSLLQVSSPSCQCTEVAATNV
jgi:signal transduction histidine kinase